MKNSEFKIISFELNGIKGISKDVKIQFLNNLVGTTIFDKSSIKILYGPNGAGKTAIVSALYFYQKIVTDSNFLINQKSNNYLFELINKKAESIYFNVVFIYKVNENKSMKIRHYIELQIDDLTNTVSIKKEVLYKLDARNNETILFDIENSKLIKTLYPTIVDKYINRLDNVSIVAKTIYLLNDFYLENNKTRQEISEIIETYIFACTLYIYFGSEDSVLYHPYIRLDESNIKKDLIKDIQNRDKEIDKRYLVSVKHENIKEYENHIKCVTKFVQLFKPELKDIEIDKRDLNNEYYINLTFVYLDGSRVDFENESTGIKKIVTLSNALEALSNGAIVIIDEIDSGIMDKVITKVVEYASKYTKGQLLLTTHHVGLMNVVKDVKHSIDFISTDSVLTKWVNDGNYNPEKVYLNGGIPHIPLNINGFDFVEVFSGEQSEE